MQIKLKKTINRFVRRALATAQPLLRHLSVQRVLVALGVVYALGTMAYYVQFYQPRHVDFSYTRPTCFSSPMLLPRLVNNRRGATFKAEVSENIHIGSYPLYASRTCISPTRAPQSNKAEIISFSLPGVGFLQKHIQVSSGSLPTIQRLATIDKPVPTKDALVFAINQTDRIFAYQLHVQDKTIPCAQTDKQLRCDVTSFNLTQSARYDFALERMFDGKVAETVFQRSLSTVEAVGITSASAAPGQIVYDAPSQLTFTLSKPVRSVEDIKAQLLVNNQPLPITLSMQDQTVTMRFTQPLPRSVSLTLLVSEVMAADGGYLPAPFSVGFKTSGGPKVLGVSIGSSRVPPGSAVTLTFDTAVSPTQAIGQFVRLEINGQPIAATVSASGRSITLHPTAALPRCAGLTVRVLDGLQNAAGIAGGSAWQFRSRVLCQTVFSIGTSVQGRAITAYSFGSGPSKIIFVGGTHGNEKSSVYILQQLVNYLETHADQIPGNRTIVVIPLLNPDGFAIDQRTNAHNVDLNRNFPTSNWKSGVTMPDKSFNPSGGGSAPLSEPESRALANYTLAQSPRLVLTYHASGGVVVPNDAGDSNSLAVTYGQKSSVGYMSSSSTAGFFEYDTTGAYEDWLGQKHGIPALLIELLTKTNNEFSGHQNAMHYIMRL